MRGKTVLILTLLLALVLRLVYINQSFWLDEATSATVARDLSLRQVMVDFAPSDFHPPGYYLMLKAWSTASGYSEFALRLPSIIFALVTIYTLHLMGSLVSGKKVGLLAALLLAVSGLHIYYSQEARMYAMSTMFVTLAVYFFAKLFEKQDKRNLVLFALALAGILLSDYLPLIILPVFWLYAVATRRGKQWWKNFTLAHIPLLLAFLGTLPLFTKQLTSGLLVETTTPLWYKILGRTTIKEVGLVPVKFIFGRINFDPPLLYGVLAVVAVAIFGYILLSAWKAKRGSFDWYWLVIPVVAAALVGVKIPAFSYFRLVFVLPAFYLLVAKGVYALKPKMAKLAGMLLVGITISSSFYYLFTPKFYREDWRGLVRFIEANSSANVATLFVADSQMEAYKFYATSVPAIAPSEFTGRQDTIWLMRYVQTIFDATDNVRANVEEFGYKKVAEHDFNGVVVWQYTK